MGIFCECLSLLALLCYTKSKDGSVDNYGERSIRGRAEASGKCDW